MSEHRQLLRSASVISAATILSRIFGYVRDYRVAFLLGAGTANDAYTIAYRIPNLLRRLVGEGAVSAAFIPLFSRYLAEEKRKEAWEFANAMLTLATVFLAALTILGIIFSPLIVNLFASGFSGTPGKMELTSTLNRIMFPYIFLISLSALTMGVLNSLQQFAAPAFAPVLLNLAVIVFSFLGGYFGDITYALAAGVVAGGVLQLAVQIPPLLKSGWRVRLKLDLSHPGVRRVTKLLGPVMFGVGIVQVNMLVDSQFASYLEEGSVTSIYIADRVMELVLGSYAVAVSTVILPLLSRQAVERRLDEMKATLNFATRVILFITIPSTVGDHRSAVSIRRLRRRVHRPDGVAASVFRARPLGLRDGEGDRAGILRAAGHAHAREDRLHRHVSEHRIELRLHRTSAKRRTGARHFAFGGIQLALALVHFSQALRRVRRERNHAIGWKVYGRFGGARRRCIWPDPMARPL
jgi:putative peptidoglycan lipid II flippase